MKITKFNFKTFLIATVICSVLTFVTLIAAAARDEGTGGDGIIVKSLEKLFYFFRFPTHTLFFQFMDGAMFFVGLFINCLFYGLLIERILSFSKKHKQQTILTLIILLLSVGFTSCNANEKFDKAKWQEQGDLRIYSHRKSMLNDLTKNYKLTGLSYRQLINLIGEPENYSDKEKNIIYYEIETDYGNDIDPVYTKTLQLKLTKDSTVESFEIKEWKK